ncbi:MAG: dephospho-CoA kinase [Alphaproteobacteria bacterium ADurb.Bin438]|nr:MAG: dephospho-CoA kinase [Alphaproteobacteria bacterium ADurb.Bin438]
MIVLDIPLLFECHFDECCDYIITLECPDFIQEKRVLARNNFNVPKFLFIKNKQMHKREKRQRSDFVVFSSLGKKKMFSDLIEVIKCVK